MTYKNYLNAISKGIEAETAIIRSSFENSSNKGSGFEIIIRNIISIYTSMNSFVTHGEIIDTFNNRSSQVDFAVVDTLHPKGYKDGRPNIIIYDCVKSIGECKMNLTTGEFDQINSSIEKKIKPFKRNIANINITGGEFYGQTDFPEKKLPPYFVVAYESNIKYETLINKTNFSKVSLTICLKHKTTNKGLIILGKTHINEDVINILDFIGERKNEYLWECDNSLLGLIWAINRFEVNSIPLTNLFPYYLGYK
jgi:hypothetical protein